ncbi:hypothetical protein C8R43DRAFT_1238185 [Mycena crocata]|nr:hypothetical protein C8R43DRAFT_1238182 [Mycena crocata]KAJ7142067.1 hypothetical protein C8R43DRAFT_1238185 [Mycena crocata]
MQPPAEIKQQHTLPLALIRPLSPPNFPPPLLRSPNTACISSWPIPQALDTPGQVQQRSVGHFDNFNASEAPFLARHDAFPAVDVSAALRTALEDYSFGVPTGGSAKQLIATWRRQQRRAAPRHNSYSIFGLPPSASKLTSLMFTRWRCVASPSNLFPPTFRVPPSELTHRRCCKRAAAAIFSLLLSPLAFQLRCCAHQRREAPPLKF